MSSSRVKFNLTLADGTVHACVGRLVSVVPSKQRSRTARDQSEPHWVIHLLTGPDLHDHINQAAPLDIVVSDGLVARVAITDGATLQGLSELAAPDRSATSASRVADE